MKIPVNFANLRLNQCSMLYGGAHNWHRFGAQFLHFRSDRKEYFPPSKKCSLTQTKNIKIWSWWPWWCGRFSIAETRFEPFLRIFRLHKWYQQRFKRRQTFNRPTTLMLHNPKALLNPEFDGHHWQRRKLKLILTELDSEIWAKQV